MSATSDRTQIMPPQKPTELSHHRTHYDDIIVRMEVMLEELVKQVQQLSEEVRIQWNHRHELEMRLVKAEERAIQHDSLLMEHAARWEACGAKNENRVWEIIKFLVPWAVVGFASYYGFSHKGG